MPFCDMKLTFFCVSTASGLLHDVFQRVSAHPIPIEICYGMLRYALTRLLCVFGRGYVSSSVIFPSNFHRLDPFSPAMLIYRWTTCIRQQRGITDTFCVWKKKNWTAGVFDYRQRVSILFTFCPPAYLADLSDVRDTNTFSLSIFFLSIADVGGRVLISCNTTFVGWGSAVIAWVALPHTPSQWFRFLD